VNEQTAVAHVLTGWLGKKVLGGVGLYTIAAPGRRSVLLILIWAHVLAIAIVVTVVVIVAVVVGGSGCGRSDRRGSPGGSPTRIIARASRYRTTWVTRATVTRTTRDGTTRPARRPAIG